MNLIKNVAPGWLNAIGGVIMCTLSFGILHTGNIVDIVASCHIILPLKNFYISQNYMYTAKLWKMTKKFFQEVTQHSYHEFQCYRRFNNEQLT